mgnify:CR=1 FL=1|jgi:hypothetical protein
MPSYEVDETIKLKSPCGLYHFHASRSGDRTGLAYWIDGKDYITTNMSWVDIKNQATLHINEGWIPY